MFRDLFSKRQSLRPTPEGLMYEDVPKQARVGLYHIVELSFKRYQSLYKALCVALRIPVRRNVTGEYSASVAIEELINNCEWWQFYDICEVLWMALDYKRDKDNLSTEVNTMFREEQLGFEMKDGKIEKVGSGFVDSRIKEARYLLKEPEFKGADEQFEKAIRALNVRPKPDVENSVKDAVSAIESVGRIIVKNDKALLPDIIRDMSKKEIIPKLLEQAIQKIYAYRGDQPGVAHGLVGISKVTIDEAEFVLAISAAAIIYLVKKSENVKTI